MIDPEHRDELLLFVEGAWTRLREACAVLTAIDLGELLAASPAAEDARQRHITAVCLLSIMHRELSALALDFERLDRDVTVR